MKPSEWNAVPRELRHDWYERLLNVSLATKKRGFGLAVHPDMLDFMNFILEKMHDDERWKNRFDEPIVVLAHPRVPPGAIMPFEDADDTVRVMTMTEAMKSNKGFGRWAGIAAPKDGMISDPFGYKNGSKKVLTPKPGNGKKRRRKG
jgi:hypothetical protein